MNDLSSICAMFNKGSTAALQEGHLRHHMQVLNTFVGRLCSVALPQLFGEHFGHLYDACSFISSVLPEDMRTRLVAVCDSAQEDVNWALKCGTGTGTIVGAARRSLLPPYGAFPRGKRNPSLNVVVIQWLQ